MARTVTDMARLLDVLVGYDLEDEWTSINAYTNVDSYTDYLDEDGLEGKRIGVLRERFGSDDNPDAAPVNALVEERLEQFREAGAELVDPVSIADVEEQIQDTEVYEYYATIHLNAFLEERDDIPYDSVREICDAGAYHESLVLLEAIAEMNVVPEEELDFWRQSLGQESFRRDIMNTFATNDLDAILFPDVQVVPEDRRTRGQVHDGELPHEHANRSPVPVSSHLRPGRDYRRGMSRWHRTTGKTAS